jgi:phosphatidylglycerophosphate synthase
MSGPGVQEASAQRDLPGLAADGLTLARFLIAVALVPMLTFGWPGVAAMLLGFAWLSDFFDGRAARASSGPTSLGDLDLWADTMVGAGVLLGVTFWGRVPVVLGVGVVVVLLAAFAITQIEAMSMVVQATGYGLILWNLWRDGYAGSLAWLLAIVAGIAVVNRRILWERSIPTFLGGIATLLNRQSER